jgi:hypothetical protein
MVLVVVLGGGMGWIVHRARVQREAVTTIERAGGQVWYGETLPTLMTKVPTPPRWKLWLIDHLGVDCVKTVGHVMVGEDIQRPQGASSPKTIDDSFLAEVGKLGHLQSLSIWRQNRVTAAGLAQLRGPNLRSFTLRDSRVESLEAMTRLAQFPSLDFLDLEGSPTNDAGLAPLARFRSLAQLNLKGTRISDRGLAHLERLPTLKFLDLTGTQITDAGMVHLARLAGLTSLYLGGTAITDAGMIHLAPAFSTPGNCTRCYGASRRRCLPLDGFDRTPVAFAQRYPDHRCRPEPARWTEEVQGAECRRNRRHGSGHRVLQQDPSDDHGPPLISGGADHTALTKAVCDAVGSDTRSFAPANIDINV